MIDWAEGTRSRNYAIRHEIDARNLLELLLISLSIGIVAAALVFHSWVRVRIVDIGYEQQSLLLEEQALSKTQESLNLEEQTLKSPDRIDALARAELGMQSVRASQVMATAGTGVELAGASVLALATSPGGPIEPRKAASVY
jgi:cell division protein FtsL